MGRPPACEVSHDRAGNGGWNQLLRQRRSSTTPRDEEEPPPEEVIFDKAEKAAHLEAQAKELRRIDERLEEIGKEVPDEGAKARERRRLMARKGEIESAIAQAKADQDD